MLLSSPKRIIWISIIEVVWQIPKYSSFFGRVKWDGALNFQTNLVFVVYLIDLQMWMCDCYVTSTINQRQDYFLDGCTWPLGRTSVRIHDITRLVSVVIHRRNIRTLSEVSPVWQSFSAVSRCSCVNDTVIGDKATTVAIQAKDWSSWNDILPKWKKNALFG